MKAQAVLFDLGDTLMFQARQPNRDGLFAKMTSQVRPLLERWRASAALDVPGLLRELYDAVETAQPEWRARGLEVDAPFIARGALSTYGIEVTSEQAAEFWRATAIDLSEWGWQLYPDALDAMRRLRSLAMPVAVVANSKQGSAVRRRMLASMGITDELARVFVFSPDVGRPKPDPAPFRLALSELDVAPQHAVFVGDHLAFDIVGAKALGMTTVWKLNGRHDAPLAPEADYTIHDLWELFTLGLFPETAASALPQESLMPHEDGNADRY